MDESMQEECGPRPQWLLFSTLHRVSSSPSSQSPKVNSDLSVSRQAGSPEKPTTSSTGTGTELPASPPLQKTQAKPDSPEPPVSPDMFASPGSPEQPASPDMFANPGSPEQPASPDMFESPGITEQSESKNMIGKPGTREQPESAAMIVSPFIPEQPESAAMIESPSTPEQPESAATIQRPGTPEQPESAAIIERPGTPEQLESAAIIEGPGTPEQLESADMFGRPEKPESPVGSPDVKAADLLVKFPLGQHFVVVYEEDWFVAKVVDKQESGIPDWGSNYIHMEFMEKRNGNLLKWPTKGRDILNMLEEDILFACQEPSSLPSSTSSQSQRHSARKSDFRNLPAEDVKMATSMLAEYKESYPTTVRYLPVHSVMMVAVKIINNW